MRIVPWSQMHWLNPPPEVVERDGGLEVVTGARTDFWQRTSYGFVHDDGHLLAVPVPSAAALEVSFRADLREQFDQAGLMLRAGPLMWLKAGLERSDGQVFASVVVTLRHSDWSLTPLGDIDADDVVTVRASRDGDAVTVRLRIGDEAGWQLLRLAYLPSETALSGGPMCCSPTREGLRVRFESVRVGPPDDRLH